jgi:hypothetical protein
MQHQYDDTDTRRRTGAATSNPEIGTAARQRAHAPTPVGSGIAQTGSAGGMEAGSARRVRPGFLSDAAAELTIGSIGFGLLACLTAAQVLRRKVKGGEL